MSSVVSFKPKAQRQYRDRTRRIILLGIQQNKYLTSPCRETKTIPEAEECDMIEPAAFQHQVLCGTRWEICRLAKMGNGSRRQQETITKKYNAYPLWCWVITEQLDHTEERCWERNQLRWSAGRGSWTVHVPIGTYFVCSFKKRILLRLHWQML